MRAKLLIYILSVSIYNFIVVSVICKSVRNHAVAVETLKSYNMVEATSPVADR